MDGLTASQLIWSNSGSVLRRAGLVRCLRRLVGRRRAARKIAFVADRQPPYLQASRHVPSLHMAIG